ncbi:MAG: DUF1385 domain-containing protein [Chloroflexi bacterium]|nr:DUF1385 domain-containing protein [Chloroflexota bacterium]
MAEPERRASFLYAGQAVIEGIMFRGERSCTVTVRTPSGELTTVSRPVPSALNRLRRTPLTRGIVLLGETLVLGLWALRLSDQISRGVVGGGTSRAAAGGRTVAILLAGIGLFFVLPFATAVALASVLGFGSTSQHVAEGALRVTTLLTYVIAIGRIPAIQRSFAYHAAEHMVGHAYQSRIGMTTEQVRGMSPYLPWCGTTLLLLVFGLGSLAFAGIGVVSPGPGTAIAARVALPPIIASLALESMALASAAGAGPIIRAIAYPGMLLQRLTTREPSDEQLDLAIQAFQRAIANDAEDAGRR